EDLVGQRGRGGEGPAIGRERQGLGLFDRDSHGAFGTRQFQIAQDDVGRESSQRQGSAIGRVGDGPGVTTSPRIRWRLRPSVGLRNATGPSVWVVTIVAPSGENAKATVWVRRSPSPRASRTRAGVRPESGLESQARAIIARPTRAADLRSTQESRA